MVFRFLIGRTAKFFGRNTNLLFFTTLYREMYKELVDISGDETSASHILKLIGIHGTFESGRRQITVLRMFPNDPVKVMEFIDVIWYVIFGTKLDEYELVKIPREGNKYPDLIFHITKCPICGGYGDSPLDTIDCNKIEPIESYYATGLVGMLEETANFILELKKNDYRIQMQETKCFCRGDSELELKCQIVHKSIFSRDIQQLDEALERPFLVEADLESANDILSKPMDAIKDQLITLIQDKMGMSTFEFMEYFRGYEDDAIRIVGFLLIHLINENGRIIEKTCENESLAKLLGHFYKYSLEMTELTLPFDLIRDYKKSLIKFFYDIAPDDILNRFEEFESPYIVTLFYEGVKKALTDLGVNFEGLKSNIWEEMELHKIISNPDEKDKELSEEEKKEQNQKKIQLIQEVFKLMMALLAVPNRVLLSSLHGTSKALFSSGGEGIGTIRDQVTKVIDLMERL